MEGFSLEIIRLSFTLEAFEPIHLPSYKGSTFHGGFGHALNRISPTWFAYFYQPKSNDGNELPKPFVILPPLDEKQTYQAGDKFHVELVLFGRAARHTSIALAAIEFLGLEMGLGYSRGKYRIHHVSESSFSFNKANFSSQAIKLSFITRLRIKADNRLHTAAPSFERLVSRVFGRLKTLQQTCGNYQVIDEDGYRDALRAAERIITTASTLYWDDWDRYSGTQNEWMKFGGLLGNICYHGDLQAFIPALQLGEWAHIGGKTSFGLGKYSIEYEDAHECSQTGTSI
ncbi:MAG: hypothetical protein CTY34_08785 [Methylobacter sp.]|nr:MAG: hypothetical protein CTY34_08785 [Methylobacter sp.]PPD17046.1 MAG: hypothetical protein CTY24_15615 [Methylobacter sp.]PPD32291.1 MAG: hypothetical protein CTY18_10765 [Methylomonas sp.]